MKTISFILTAFLTIVLTSCDYFGTIYFNNDTDDTLFVSMAYGYFPPRSLSSYPDTLLPLDVDDDTYYKIFHIVRKHYHCSLLSQLGGSNMDNNYLIDNCIPVDTVCIFVICPDTFAKYGYIRMAEENHILARYDLSKSDLKKLEADIHYPPTPAMQNMKMYPSYKEIISRKSP